MLNSDVTICHIKSPSQALIFLFRMCLIPGVFWASPVKWAHDFYIASSKSGDRDYWFGSVTSTNLTSFYFPTLLSYLKVDFQKLHKKSLQAHVYLLLVGKWWCGVGTSGRTPNHVLGTAPDSQSRLPSPFGPPCVVSRLHPRGPYLPCCMEGQPAAGSNPGFAPGIMQVAVVESAPLRAAASWVQCVLGLVSNFKPLGRRWCFCGPAEVCMCTCVCVHTADLVSV